MPNIHLRDLPLAAMEILKRTAMEQGRSLNAELVHVLSQEAERLGRMDDFLLTVQRKQPRKGVDLEKIIREDRDSRASRAL